MEFVADEHTPTDLCDLLRYFGHKVAVSKEMIGEQWPDESVVQLADHLGAIVITWNQKDFDKVVRPRFGRLKYPRAGVFYFAVEAAEAGSRLWQIIDIFSYEVDVSVAQRRPCRMKVTRETFQVFR